ncbi:hypothetical protein FB45DRAFT_929506, partial [Roridomyces roridus]
TANPPEQMPEWICAWIMDSCDKLLIDGSHQICLALAQKMRAAARWRFGRANSTQGNVPWSKDPNTNQCSGNPSVSKPV